MDTTTLWWIFGVIVGGFLIFDLGFANRTAHVISAKSALLQSLFWIGISLAYAYLVYSVLGKTAGLEFTSAYVTEKMLSVDNLFVIALLFSYFKLEEKYHHTVLFWGIFGAVLFRGLFISAGGFVVAQFHWVLYIFGALLVYTGMGLFRDTKEEHADFNSNPVTVFARKILPFTASPHGGKFWVREKGKFYFTILFLVVLLVETTDIIFAVDSIPAAFAISQSSFIVFTSNIFAVMGLRALFFLLESVLHKFHHLQKGLSFVLIFIGAKMIIALFGIHLSSLVSFGFIIGAFVISLVLSVLFPKKI